MGVSNFRWQGPKFYARYFRGKDKYYSIIFGPNCVVHECVTKKMHVNDFLQIVPGSIAERLGIRVRDMIIKINNEPSADITNSDAVALVNKGANNFALTLQR